MTFILVPKMNTQMLDIYTDYLISQNHYATATGLATLLENEISHDQVTRFLHSGDFGSKELWLQTKANVKASEKATGGVLIVDDTIGRRTTPMKMTSCVGTILTLRVGMSKA